MLRKYFDLTFLILFVFKHNYLKLFKDNMKNQGMFKSYVKELIEITQISESLRQNGLVANERNVQQLEFWQIYNCTSYKKLLRNLCQPLRLNCIIAEHHYKFQAFLILN